MTGLLISSIRYRRRKEGIAIKIKMIADANFQATSINWSSNKNRLVNLLKINITIWLNCGFAGTCVLCDGICCWRRSHDAYTRRCVYRTKSSILCCLCCPRSAVSPWKQDYLQVSYYYYTVYCIGGERDSGYREPKDRTQYTTSLWLLVMQNQVHSV